MRGTGCSACNPAAEGPHWGIRRLWRANSSPFQRSPAASCLPFSDFALRPREHIPLDPPIYRGQISEDGHSVTGPILDYNYHGKKDASLENRAHPREPLIKVSICRLIQLFHAVFYPLPFPLEFILFQIWIQLEWSSVYGHNL